MKTLAITLFIALAATLGFAQGPPFPYSVNLSWTPSVTPGNTGQNVYRAAYTTSCGTYSVLPAGANIGPSLATFADSTIVAGGSYCFGATAIGANGKESALALFAPSPLLIPPAPPTGATDTVAQVNGQEDVTVAWKQSVSSGITGNDVYAGVKPGGPYNLLHVHLQPTTQVTDKGVAKGTYFAIVTASAKTGQSGKSNEVKIVVP